MSYNFDVFLLLGGGDRKVQSQPYEFDQAQNRLIRELSQKMSFVGYFLIALGVLLILVGIVRFRIGGFGNLIQGVIQIIIGIWTKQAATSFQLIVNTQENDIQNLMGALRELRKLYTLQYWIFLIAVILLAFAIVIALIFGVFGLIGR